MGKVNLLGISDANDYYENINKLIEKAGRTCYLSGAKDEKTSADKFISKVIRGYRHESIAGHAYFNMNIMLESEQESYKFAYLINDISNGNVQVFVDGRSVLVGMNWRSVKQMLDSGTEIGRWIYWYLQDRTNKFLFYDIIGGDFGSDFYKKRKIVFTGFNPDLSNFPTKIQNRFTVATMKFTGYNRTFSHQLVRHMGINLKNVYSEMSQRYVNPTLKNKDNLYSVPIPIIGHTLEKQFRKDVDSSIEDYSFWVNYMKEFKKQNPDSDFAKPEEVARDLLPNAMNTEIVATMTIESWIYFIRLRTGRHAQYHMRDAAKKAKQQLINFGINI